MSKDFEKIAHWYDAGVWNEEMVRRAHARGRLTDDELAMILGEDA